MYRPIIKSYFYHISVTTDIQNTVVYLENSVRNNCRELQNLNQRIYKILQTQFMVNQSIK